MADARPYHLSILFVILVALSGDGRVGHLLPIRHGSFIIVEPRYRVISIIILKICSTVVYSYSYNAVAIMQ